MESTIADKYSVAYTPAMQSMFDLDLELYKETFQCMEPPTQSIGRWRALKYTRHPIYGASPAANFRFGIIILASITTVPIRIIRVIPSTPRSRRRHGEPRFSRGSTHNLDPVAGVEDQCANHRSSRWYREPSHSTGNTENPDPAGNAQSPDYPGKNTQSPDPLVGNTQNSPSRRDAEPSHSHWQYAEPKFSRWHRARRAQLLTSATRRTQPFPPRPASLSPTGDFMLINDDWASHDLTIDEKWAAFTKKVRELSGDKIDVSTLVKPSGPSNSVLTTQWHFPTWVTESPFYGSVMDDTNSSLRDQSSTCIVGS
ncbi:hypothetical protein CEP52_002745 [Fusarium oligoseptatum]|uniref:Uncharacterized protein n=1 Tax=Fusarium oligoseptatum TaxID=2604345 RepID=A0A428UC51_9HYPO|nr:hypothetical protein CEP52_002745 [Fusarium oligoseptatum]